jgi:hypothetical protein
MLSSVRQLLSRNVGKTLESRVLSAHTTTRFQSSSLPESDEKSLHSYAFDENGEAADDIVSFPVTGKDDQREDKPVLLNSKEHAVGYLSKILNARVYEAAIETELQEAKNLSAVRPWKKIPSRFKVTMLLFSHQFAWT